MQNDFSNSEQWVNDKGKVIVLWLPETVENLRVFSSVYPASSKDCFIYEAGRVTFIKDGRDYLEAHRYKEDPPKEVPNY